MKLLTGWAVSAGLLLAASAAQAQMLAPYDAGRSPHRAVSDVDGPYPGLPQEPPAYRYGQGYGYGPTLLPPQEVYTVLRESGFSPLGIPHQRGFVYTISVIDRAGEDGRLVIDARNGRILRFVPAYGMSENFEGDLMAAYGPEGARLPPTNVRGVPRPPASIPHVASRTVPMPKPAPARAVPDSLQQAAVVPAKPADAPVTTGTVGEAKPLPPAPAILPTQDMPKAQGLE